MIEVIAERVFTDVDGVPVIARWYKPEPDPGGDWMASYSIQVGDEVPEHRNGYGVDSMQALHSAMMLAAVHLELFDPPLQWLEGPDLALPTLEGLHASRRRHPEWAPVVDVLRTAWLAPDAGVSDQDFDYFAWPIVDMVQRRVTAVRIAHYLGRLRTETFKLLPDHDSDMGAASKLLSLRSQ